VKVVPLTSENRAIEIPKSASQAVISGQLSRNTSRAYAADIKAFLLFIGGEDKLSNVTKDMVVAYRNRLLEEGYKPATINRKLSSIRQLFEEAVDRKLVEANPAARVKGLKQDNNYSPTAGISREEARHILDSIDTSTLIGKRDYALWMLMLRTGLRRQEVVLCRTVCLGERDGYRVLTVIGKGSKTRLAKLPVDVVRALDDWLSAAGVLDGDFPLFTEVRKVGRGKEATYAVVGTRGLTVDGIWHIIRRRATKAGISSRITPHSTRVCFITLALKGGAPLHKVQYAAGHADPRTTERYDREQDNLDDNAVDYVRL